LGQVWKTRRYRAREDEWGEPRLEVFNTVTFAESNGKTTPTLHAVVVKAGPGTDRAVVGMEQGWTESLERLERFTSTAKSMIDDSRTGSIDPSTKHKFPRIVLTCRKGSLSEGVLSRFMRDGIASNRVSRLRR
jgi:hypothetical protein